MILLLFIVLCVFLSFYLGCFDSENLTRKRVAIACFVISSIFLRILLKADYNNDYYLYYNFQIFHKPTSLLSFFINEPYLYSVYSFFKLFTPIKETVFIFMYWFNFTISTLFFVWLLLRKDIELYKKMIIFVCYYFVITYVVLRNGPVYILFALYFYYTFRNKKFNWVLITPLLHISSSLLLITFIHNYRYYFRILIILPLLLFLFVFILIPFLAAFEEFQTIISKINIYSAGMVTIGIMHKLFFIFIVLLYILGYFFYKRKILHPILVTTFLLYAVTYFINPVVAFRFSPYFIFAMMLYPLKEFFKTQKLRMLNLSTVLLFPIFVYAMFNSHRNELFMMIFNN
jgi:hypothetical protein